MLGKYAKVVFLISLVLVIVSTMLALWGAPFIVNRQIQKSVQLTPDSMMYEKWRKLPVPMDFKIYVFNVTNPEEVNQGAKPKLQEIGPYVYKQYRERTVLGLGPNDTIKYMLKKTFVFDPQASETLSPDDEVTVINFSYMAAILSVYELMPSFVNMVNGALQQFFGGNLTDPFLRVRVSDLFFDGIFLNCSGDHSALGLVCGKIRSESPPNMRPAEDGENGFYFSMFSHMNLTETGPFEMVRGTENVRELGHIFSYKNATRMNYWGDKYCGMINGSDSTIFPPMDEANIPQRLYSFEPEICRSLYTSLVEKRELFELPAYYYEIPESALAAKSANHDNQCFCRHDWSGNHDGCLLMGLLNLNPCQGAPAIASLPHFYLGSEELLEYFAEGVQPDREKHASYAYLDPVTGAGLRGAKRMQFNIELRQMPNTPQLAKVPTGLFPLLWIEEGAEIPTDVQEELRNAHQKLMVVRLLPWIALGVTLVCMLASAAFLVRAGALPCFPRASNSVSFIMRPATNKVH